MDADLRNLRSMEDLTVGMVQKSKQSIRVEHRLTTGDQGRKTQEPLCKSVEQGKGHILIHGHMGLVTCETCLYNMRRMGNRKMTLSGQSAQIILIQRPNGPESSQLSPR